MRASRSRFASTLAIGLRRLGHAARAFTGLALALASLVPASAQITTTSANNLITAGLNGSGSFTCSLPALNNGFTIEAWVRPTTHTGYSRIADIGSSYSQNVNLCVSQWTTGRPLLTINQGGTGVLWLEAPSSVPLSTWSHIAGVVNSDLSAQLYVNGQLVASGTASALPPATAATSSFIGRARNDVDPILDGALADVRIWTTARTQAQIQANMPVGSITGATTGLAAAYPFGSTGSGVLSDISGAGRNLTQSGTVTFEKSGTGTVTTQGLAGTSALTVSDGSLNFNTTQTYTGGTFINGGTLQLAVDGADVGVIRGDVTVGAQGRFLLQGMNALGWGDGVRVSTININGGLVESTAPGDQGWGLAYRMTGGELRSNGGVPSTSSNSRFSMGGGTSITSLASPTTAVISGSIRIRDGNPNNVLPIDVADGAASPDLLISAGIVEQDAAGGITKTGAGLLALTGPASYAGTTTISAGTLQVGDGGTTGSLGSGNVVNNASLVFNRSDNISVANTISGTGSVTKDGAGSLFLNTIQTYTGGTVINRGALWLSGNYSGVGIIRGNVTVGPEGRLQLQDGVGLGWIAGSKVDTITINGGLVHKLDSGGDGWGIAYRMTGGELRAAGSDPNAQFLMGGGSSITTLANPTTALVNGTLLVREGNPNNAMLLDVADGAASPDLLITGSITQENGPNGITKTGAGLLALAGPASYGGTTTISAGTLQVGNGGTTGSLGSGNVVNNATLAFNRSDDIYVGNGISGTGTLVQNGTGTVTFGNARPDGGTLVQRGILRVNGIRTHLGNITLQPGTSLLVDGWDSLGYDIDPPWVTTVTVNEATVTMAGGPNQASSTDFILNGGRITGTMTWTLVSATPANNTASVSTLASATTSVIDANAMAIAQQSVTFDVADGEASPDLRMSTVASGTGGLVKAGAGLMVLSGNNTYTGTTTVSAGTLQVGNGGSSGALGSGNVVNNATLAFNRSDAVTVPNAISGTGNLLKQASEAVILTGNNSYAGITTVSAGTLQVGNGGTSGSLGAGNVVNNATLTFNRSDSIQVGNAISGTGTLVQDGTGTVTFGNASPGGGTLVQRGTLRVNGIKTHLGNITLQPGTFLFVDGHDSLGYDISPPWVTTVTVNEATVTMAGGPNQASSTDFILNGGRITGTMNWTLVSATPANNTASVSTLASATTSVIDANTMAISQQSVTFDVADGTASPDLRMSTVASGTGGLVKAGAGTMALSGTNTYSGNTTILAGTLALTGSGSFNSSPTITLASGATLDTSGRSSALALGASQTLANSGGTALLQGDLTATSGTLALAFTAGTPALTVSSGTLTLDAKTALRVTVSGSALAAGTYKLVAKGTGGAVSGAAPSVVTVDGTGLASGLGARTEISDGEVLLRVVPTATITLGNLSQAYTGSARTPSATTVPSGLSVAFTYNGSSAAPVTVGSYPVVATISDTNYVGTASGTLVITKAPASISLGNVFQSYDGTARRVVAATEPPGLSWTATYNGSANAPTNLGIYNVVATISDANYMGFTNGVLNVKAGNPGARPDPTAQPPAYLNHHGYLTDASGNPLGSPNPRNYDLVFRIFSAPSGGASLWAESQVVTIDQGEYDVMLGEGMSQGVEPWPALDAVLASGTGSARYLEVTVRSIGIGGSDLTISPRLVLPSQPYAFLARHAQEAQTLTSPDGSRLLQVTGTTVGVGIGDRLANATLDVGGGLTVESLVSRGNSSVGGTYSASLFTGDGTIPIGGIVVWSGGDIPEGWAICDGRTVNGRRTPNLQSRFVLGTSSKYAYGTAGGSERHVLREEHLPSHTHLFDPPPTTTNPSQHHSHTFQTHSAGPRDAFGAGGDRTSSDPLATRTAAAERSTAHSPHNHSGRLTVSGGSSRVGGGQSHNGMPPFYVLAYIMRVQ